MIPVTMLGQVVDDRKPRASGDDPATPNKSHDDAG